MTATNSDLDHLRLLSIFHYVVGGLCALFAFFPIIHIIMGVIFLNNPEAFNSSGTSPKMQNLDKQLAQFMGVLFVILPMFFMALGFSLAGMVIYAGRCLSQYRRYTLCLVTAGVMCMFMPFGTVLGVFTLVVLLRPQVKELFQSPTADTYPPPQSAGLT